MRGVMKRLNIYDSPFQVERYSFDCGWHTCLHFS